MAVAEHIASKIKSYRAKRMILGFVDCNSVTDAERILLSAGYSYEYNTPLNFRTGWSSTENNNDKS